MQETHRPGPLKQQNKSHKHGRHRSNRQIQTAAKGKMDVKKISKKINREFSRAERRNQMKHHRNVKRQQAISLKRRIGVENTPPILIGLYCRATSCKQLLGLIKECDQDAIVKITGRSSVHISVPKFKLRYNFILIPENDLHALLDTVKIVDILMLVHSIATEADIEDDELLNAAYSYFLPTTIHVVNGLESVPVKKRHEIKTRIQKAINSRFPDEKIHTVDKHQEALQLLHMIGNCKRKKMSYKSRRSQILAEEFKFESSEDGNSGKLVVSGFVRSRPLNVNGLVHIPGFGDYQIDMIEALDDPYPLNERKKNTSDTEMTNLRTLKPDLMLQESTDRENELDPMEGEQTFPTAEEIAEVAAKTCKKTVKKVPPGTSDYQAAWIIDDGGEDGLSQQSFAEDTESESNEMDAAEQEEEESKSSNEDSDSGEEVEMDSVTVNENEDDKYDEKTDDDDEMRRKYREAREEALFPDEVDTPLDIAARVRFARYRGLRSFNYSAWDPKENLPPDYSRIFQFQNFNRTKRRILNEVEDGEERFHMDVGSFVRVTLRNVSHGLYQHFTRHIMKPLILYGLLKYEQKMSVVNVLLKKHSSYNEPIKSKERLIFHVGCRRFANRPIFSAHTNGNKFKYEKFLRSDAPVVASMFAPITIPPASVVVFRENTDGSHTLVATGSVISVDPDRAVIKRIILSGHPVKINKKLAVVRYMFFNKEDIEWFKPVELKTKYGRKGHIKESLGTHGHMKCFFDRQLSSMDTVLMNLYKRVYPKWTYEDYVADPVESEASSMEEQVDL